MLVVSFRFVVSVFCNIYQEKKLRHKTILINKHTTTFPFWCFHVWLLFVNIVLLFAHLNLTPVSSVNIVLLFVHLYISFLFCPSPSPFLFSNDSSRSRSRLHSRPVPCPGSLIEAISSLLSSRLWCNRVNLPLHNATPKAITDQLFSSVVQPSGFTSTAIKHNAESD
jgi:hypothetical protein